jgi:hypothetical protein
MVAKGPSSDPQIVKNLILAGTEFLVTSAAPMALARAWTNFVTDCFYLAKEQMMGLVALNI